MATSKAVETPTATTFNPETGEIDEEGIQELASVVSVDGAAKTIDSLSGARANVVSSFEGSDFETLIKVASVVGNAEPISDHLGETINLRNYVAQATEVESLSKPGTMDAVVRIVLVDDELNAYAAISVGIAKSLENLVGIVGKPATWQGPIPIKVVSKKGKRGNYYTVQYVRGDDTGK
jgi:hypothetical protein